jgi:hypothetical protein
VACLWRCIQQRLQAAANGTQIGMKMIAPNSSSTRLAVGRRLQGRANLFTRRFTPEELAYADLARSGLTIEAGQAVGMFTVSDASEICSDFAAAPALIIPYMAAPGVPHTYKRGDATLPFCRARYLAPNGAPLPRGRKYDQPSDSGTPPYFPQIYDWAAFGRGDCSSCVIVEGEKKAAALCSVGIPAMAVGGVFNFSDEGFLHPDIGTVAGQCEDVYILFDSDAATKPQVQIAEFRLAGQLALLGTTVHIVRIPLSGPDKVGADDFLVANGKDALEDLILETPALGAITKAPTEPEVSLDELLRRVVSPVEELIPGLIEKNIPNFLAGPGGSHKSRLALQFGICINAGETVWGLGAQVDSRRNPKATLVYCAAEDDENELARRAQAICSGLRIKTTDRAVFISRKGKDSALVYMHESAKTEVRPFFHYLINKLRGIPGHKLLVLDSAYDFVRFVGRAKIDEDAVNYFIKVVLQGICDQCDATIIIPWHPSQAGSERDSMDGWSVAWHNAPRARLGISADKDVEDTYDLKVLKRNHGRKGPPIKLRYVEGIMLPTDAVPDDGKRAAFKKVCIAAAVEAASHSMPLNRRGAIRGTIYKEAEKVLCRRPGKQEIRDTLEDAVRSGELLYLNSTRHRAAGFYPNDPELAKDLANVAKKAARSSADG